MNNTFFRENNDSIKDDLDLRQERNQVEKLYGNKSLIINQTFLYESET